MKKTIIIISVLFFSTNVKSQITKGYWMFGGDAIVRGYKFDNSTKYTFYAEIFPKVGYFISDKIVLGTELGFWINKDNFYVSIIPFSRYYILESKKIVNPFIEGGVGVSSLNNTQTTYRLMYQLKVGTSIFFNQSTALNITLNYKKNSFQFSQEISLAIGFQIHLEKR